MTYKLSKTSRPKSGTISQLFVVLNKSRIDPKENSLQKWKSPFLDGLVSGTIVIAVCSFSFLAIGFVYLQSYASVFNLDYSSFDVTPQEQMFAGWLSDGILGLSVSVLCLSSVFGTSLVGVFMWLLLRFFRFFQHIFKKFLKPRPNRRLIFFQKKKLRRKAPTYYELVLKHLMVLNPIWCTLIIGSLMILSLLVAAARDSGLRGERDAIQALHTGPIVELKQVNGPIASYRYLRKIGDKTILALIDNQSNNEKQFEIMVVKNTDIVFFKTKLDEGKALKQFDQDRRLGWR